MKRIFLSLILSFCLLGKTSAQDLILVLDNIQLKEHFQGNVGYHKIMASNGDYIEMLHDADQICFNYRCLDIKTDIYGFTDGINYFYSFRLTNGWLVLLHFIKNRLHEVTIIINETQEIVYNETNS